MVAGLYLFQYFQRKREEEEEEEEEVQVDEENQELDLRYLGDENRTSSFQAIDPPVGLDPSRKGIASGKDVGVAANNTYSNKIGLHDSGSNPDNARRMISLSNNYAKQTGESKL